MAKYDKIVKDIESSIRSGELMAYDQLPTVVDLTERYSVSRSTIEQVLNELEKRGLVSRKRGAGVFVKGVSQTETRINSVSVFRDEKLLPPEPEETEVHEFTVVVPSDEIRAVLGLHENSFCYYICRSQIRDGLAYNVEYIYYPVEVFHDVRIEAAARSLREFIKSRYDFVPDSFHKRLRSVMPTKDELEYLGIEDTTPLLELEQIAYLSDGRPCEYYLARFRGEFSEYQTVDNESQYI